MDAEDVEAARRALYAPGATAANVTAYAAAVTQPFDTAVRSTSPSASVRTGGSRFSAGRIITAGLAVLSISAITGAWIVSAAAQHATAAHSAATPTADPTLWSAAHRAQTRTALQAMLHAPQERADPSQVDRLLAARAPQADVITTTVSGFGMGTSSEGEAGTFSAGEATVIVAFDRPCHFDWTASVSVPFSKTTTGGWQQGLKTQDHAAAGSADAYMPLESSFRLTQASNGVRLRIHAPRGVRYVWLLELASG
jgi:hypothetical protein